MSTDIVERLNARKVTREFDNWGMYTNVSHEPTELDVEAAATIEELREALEPFANSFIAESVDENGWTSTVHREAISTWFGPSDFRRARALLPKDKP